MGGTHRTSMSERHTQHSHLTMGGTHPKTHVIKAQHSHPTLSFQKGSALTSNLILSERLCTYIRPHPVRKALHLHLTSSCQKGSTLTSEHVGTHLVITSEWLCTYHMGIHPTITSEYLCIDHVLTQPTITLEHLCTYI